MLVRDAGEPPRADGVKKRASDLVVGDVVVGEPCESFEIEHITRERGWTSAWVVEYSWRDDAQVEVEGD